MKRVYMVEIELGNAAFEDGESDEVGAILHWLQDKLVGDGCLAEHVLFDTNGNRVGRARVAKRSK